MTRFLLLPLLALALPVAAQGSANAFVPRDVVVLQSTRSYVAALQTARQAATRLHIKLDL